MKSSRIRDIGEYSSPSSRGWTRRFTFYAGRPAGRTCDPCWRQASAAPRAGIKAISIDWTELTLES